MCLWFFLFAFLYSQKLILGSKLLEHGRIEAAKLGYKKVYLATDHNGYYERYGWVYIGKGIHPWGDESRIYEHDTIQSGANTKTI